MFLNLSALKFLKNNINGRRVGFRFNISVVLKDFLYEKKYFQRFLCS